MKIQNTSLYSKFKTYVQGACRNSLEWGPGRSEFEAFLDFLEKEKSVVETIKWWEPHIEPRVEISSWVMSFIYVYQDILSTLVWNEQVFDQVYEDFERFLYSRALRVTCASPLYFFECNSKKPIELDTDVGLTRTNDIKNVKRLYNRLEVKGHAWQKSDWYIYTYIDILKSKPRTDSSLPVATADIENVLTSLRLVAPALVYIGGFYSDEGSPFAGVHGGYRSMMHSPMFGLPSSEYVVFSTYSLEKDKISDLKRVYQQLSALSKPDNDFLSVPISRFNNSYMHLSDKDKLIDLCIAMESLYVREYQELSYKLALRGAYFLEEDDFEKRCRAFIRIKQIYKGRNDIVHGKTKQPANLDELINDAKDYLRRSVLKLLSTTDGVGRISKKTKEHELHFLDKCILKGNARSNDK